MYREMTPEEKLEYSAEIIGAIKNGGLISSLEVVEKYKKILSNEILIEKQANIPVQEDSQQIIETISNEVTPNIVNKGITAVNSEFPTQASIYAPEHIEAVEEDKEEQSKELQEPKMRVLEQTKTSAPNPWGEAKMVSPGELKL